MKSVFFVIVALLLGVTLSGQVPQSFRYQAVARDNSGNILANQPVSFRISILSGSVSGKEVYIENHTSLSTNTFGLVEMEIGKGDPETGVFSDIDWSKESYFVKVEMDPAGGKDYQALSTSQLLSVPYSLFSETAGTAIDAVKITGNQTIEGEKTFTGIISTSNKPVKNVADPVSSKDAANKDYVDKMLLALGLIPNNFAGIAEDIDGNVYKTVMLGTQVWMADNLKVTKYNNGTEIPNIKGDAQWAASTAGAYCWYNNDIGNKSTYGALYNWHAVKAGKLCPTGWHVPSDAEWTTLENYLIANGYNYDGTTTGNKIAKSLAAATNWAPSTITGAVGNTDFPAYRNKTGFSALPGGYRVNNGTFNYIPSYGYWWSSSEPGISFAWSRYLGYDYSYVSRFSYNKEFGFSVRCVRDN